MEYLLNLLVFVLQIYYYMLIAFILLSWIPSIRQSKLYWYLGKVTDPYMRIFRGWFVFGQLDFTPIVGFMLYSFGLDAIEFYVATSF
ncbi:MAG: YggT family protein [Candidatus Izemoplasma sp.]